MRGDVTEPVDAGGAQACGGVQTAHNSLGDYRAPLLGQQSEQPLLGGDQNVYIGGFAVEEAGDV